MSSWSETLQGTMAGATPGTLGLENEVNPLFIKLRFVREDRAQQADLEQLMMKGANGEGVYLADLGTFDEGMIDQPIYHKNLRRVVYVLGDTAGLPPPDAVLELSDEVKDDSHWNCRIDLFHLNCDSRGILHGLCQERGAACPCQSGK